MDGSMPGFAVLLSLLEFSQTHVHWVDDVIQLSHPLSSPSPPALNVSQHQGLLRWVGFSYLVARVLELQLQHQSFQWIFWDDFLKSTQSKVFSSTTVLKYQFLIKKKKKKCLNSSNSPLLMKVQKCKEIIYKLLHFVSKWGKWWTKVS